MAARGRQSALTAAASMKPPAGCRGRPAAPRPWLRHAHPRPDAGADHLHPWLHQDAQLMDDLSDTPCKRYIHHYNFPPYSVGEARAPAAPAAARSATATLPSAP